MFLSKCISDLKQKGVIKLSKLQIEKTRCKGCRYCIEVCPKKALSFSGEISDQGYDTVKVDDALCIQCGACYRVCPDYVFEII